MTATRLLGHGPIMRLASLATDAHTYGNGGVGSPFARTSWNAGRTLTAEEWRCGMLLHSYSDAAAAAVAAVPATSSAPLFGAMASGAVPAMLSQPRTRQRHNVSAATDGRLGAVVKAQSSDFQVTEVDACGSAACLEAAPRARWRKVIRNASMLIEDSPHERFDEPDKAFSPRTQHLGAYVRQLGSTHDAHAAVHFVLYRDAYSLPQVLHRFAYEVAMKADAVHLHDPPGGYYGCVSQRGVCVGGTRDALLHVSRRYNVRPLLLNPCGYCDVADVSARMQPPRAHLYRLLLRCVQSDEADVLARVGRLARHGFVNYFGVERFGVGSSALHHVAACAARGDLARAVGAVLQTMAEADATHFDNFMSYINAEADTVTAMAAAWRDKARLSRAPKSTQELLDALYDYHVALATDVTAPWTRSRSTEQEQAQRREEHEHNMQAKQTPHNAVSGSNATFDDTAACTSGTASAACGAGCSERTTLALQRLWTATGMLSRCQRAAAEFVWNAVASQRLLSYGNRVVVGDVVRTRLNNNNNNTACGAGGTESTDTSSRAAGNATYCVVQNSADAAAYSIDDVVLPVPYAHGQQHSILYPQMTHVNKELYTTLAHRHSLTAMLHTHTPEGVSDASPVYRPLLCRPSMLQAAVVHDPSSYATLKTDAFCLQERKASSSLTLEYAKRMREPCRYNVSERFAERMMRMCEAEGSGEQTLAISFLLPHSTSALVALRDVFALRYGHFSDMYGL